jgi:protein SCO1/2
VTFFSESEGLGAKLQGHVARIVGRPGFWALFVGAIFSWPIVWTLNTPLPPRFPVLAELPRFELTDEEGRPFGTAELEGQVWVASFIFTRCTTICPAITARMKGVQDRTRQLAPAFHLVSFSVDPGFDTPERLSEYAREHHASPRLWSFLTGDEEAVKATVVRGLKMAMGRERSDDGSLEGIFHGSHLVLVDARGRVRAYFDSDEPGVVDRVVRAAGLLVNRGD